MQLSFVFHLQFRSISFATVFLLQLPLKPGKVRAMETQERVSSLDFHVIDKKLVDKMVYDSLVWSSLHGLVVGDKSVQVCRLSLSGCQPMIADGDS